jgi:hypothetical protein
MPPGRRHRWSWAAVAVALLSLPACSTFRPPAPDPANPPAAQVTPAAPSAGVRDTSAAITPGIQQVAARTVEPAPSGGPPAPPQPDRTAGCAFRWDRLDADVDLSCQDWRDFYSCWNLTMVGLGVGVAAPLANTSADQSIRNWYQDHVHSHAANDFANVMNGASSWVVVPLAAEGAALFGMGPDDYAHDGGFFEWSNRSVRALAVGYPPVLAGYVLLGSSRPGPGGSHWHPFNDWHGISGHTFDEAIPFLTAAEMTDNDLLKAGLFLGSMAGGWARLHADQHYFSQIVLGWWMAYLAVRRVDDTQRDHSPFMLVPTTADGPGVGVLVRY